MRGHFYNFGEKFMKVVAIAFSGLIFLAAFLLTAYNYVLTDHKFDIRWDSIPVTLVGMVMVLGVGVLLYLIVRKNRKRVGAFAVVVAVAYVLTGFYLVVFGRSMPNSDSWVVYEMAKEMASGDLSIINPTRSYMSYYPQQIGICAFLSWIIRFVRLFPITVEEFHFVMLFYSVFEGITVFALYKAVDALWGNEKIDFAFLYLSLLNFPLLMYSEYLYGEIPALMFFSLGAWMLANLFAGKGRLSIDMVLSVIFFGMSVFVRKNSIILILGVFIALFFETIRTKKIRFLLTGIAIGIVAFSVLPMTVKHYEKKSGGTLTTGVTALSYFAMGMQEGPTGPGWYNGFNFDTFEKSGCNPEAANEIAKEAIAARKAEFKESPSLALDFYWRKFVTQWVDGTYSSRESTHVYYGDRSAFISKIYEETYGKYYILVCNIVQSIIFLGCLIWAVTSFGKRNGDFLWKSFIFIGVFGGFLFHMIWEANSRYILTYACLLYPYAAAGFGRILSGRGYRK